MKLGETMLIIIVSSKVVPTVLKNSGVKSLYLPENMTKLSPKIGFGTR